MTYHSAYDERSWRQAMTDLAFTCAAAQDDEAGDLVRMASALIAAAPSALQSILPQAQAGRHTMAQSGHELAEMLDLLKDCAGLMLSHGPGGDYLATVAFEGTEASAEAAHPAIALVGAMAMALAGPGLSPIDNPATRQQPQPVRLN